MEEGYLLTNRNGVFRLQYYGNKQLAQETMSIHKSKGMDVVAVTEEELYRFFKRYSINLKVRKDNENRLNNNKRATRLSIAEKIGKLQELYDLVSYLFKVEKKLG